MKRMHKFLLALDGGINLFLGIVLLLFPFGFDRVFGLPVVSNLFYSSILGGVIFGIGVALLVELWGARKNIRGLGLGGAIVINICGAGVLLFWLVSTDLEIPLRGQIILWIVAIVVMLVGIVELLAKSWRRPF